MFKIQSDILKGIVGSLAKGARKTSVVENFIFIRTLETDEVSFFFTGAETSVERKVKADIQGQVDVATTMRELEVRVAALPSEEEVLFEVDENQIKLKWGKKSVISADTVPETIPLLDIPKMKERVKWAPGRLHGIARVLTPFSAAPNSSHGQRNASVAGPNFMKDQDTGEVFVRATDGYRAVTMNASKIEWFNEPVSIESGNLLGVADVMPKDAEITVGINEGASLVVFSSGSSTAVVRTLAGTFPQIDKMYRSKGKSKWIIDRMELIELCRRVRILSPQKPILEFRYEGQKVKAVVPKTLNQSLSVVIEGEPFEFAVNATYLEMAASLFRNEEVNLLMEDANHTITVNVDGSETIRALLCPVRLS